MDDAEITSWHRVHKKKFLEVGLQKKLAGEARCKRFLLPPILLLRSSKDLAEMNLWENAF
jgi:hypothetical protein